MAEEKKEATAVPGDGVVESKRAERGGISRRGLFIGVGSTVALLGLGGLRYADRKSTRLNSSHT